MNTRFTLRDALAAALDGCAAPFGIILVLLGALIMLTGCDRGPADADMAGCTTSTRAPTHRDVADCAVQRAERRSDR